MNLHHDPIERRISLRDQAESMVARFYPLEAATHTSEKLLHELIIHKIELELQNEELRLAHAPLLQRCNFYRNLFDDAPLGYLILDEDAQILEANRAAAALFGEKQGQMIYCPVCQYIAPQDVDRWILFIKDLFANGGQDRSEVDLMLTRRNGQNCAVHLQCVCRQSPEQKRLAHIIVMDAVST